MTFDPNPEQNITGFGFRFEDINSFDWTTDTNFGLFLDIFFVWIASTLSLQSYVKIEIYSTFDIKTFAQIFQKWMWIWKIMKLYSLRKSFNYEMKNLLDKNQILIVFWNDLYFCHYLRQVVCLPIEIFRILFFVTCKTNQFNMKYVIN